MSSRVPATYYDGRTSRPRHVLLRFSGDGTLALESDTGELVFSRSQVQVESRLGDGPRFVRLPDDQRCEVTDNDALDAALAMWAAPGAAAWLHRVEQSWRLVAVSVVALLVFGWMLFAYGVPWGAKRVAFMLPAGVVNALGDETLGTFDRTVFEPSTLDGSRRAELRAKFADFLNAAGDTTTYRIEFRSAPRFGANAFALPSGVIVITDELVKLAGHDDEIIGVVAHECGHVHHRHILRSVLQNSAVVVALALTTGDISSTTALGGAIPAYLLQSRFSREFEVEADTYAITLMKRAGMPASPLATMLERLEAGHHKKEKAGDIADTSATETPAEERSRVLDYISTHPPTEKRVQAIRDADAD